MATMEVAGNSGGYNRGKQHAGTLSPTCIDALKNEEHKDLPALHSACLYGELHSVQELLGSKQWWINNCDSQGLYPIHMVVFSGVSQQTPDCLKCLLENEADVNVTTPTGQTALHLAASNGLFRCVKILVNAGADLTIQDTMGFTAIDLARVWCRREIGRYLKNSLWHALKKKEMEKRIQLQVLYRDLLHTVKHYKKEKKALIDKVMAEWARKKGFTLRKDLPIRILGVSKYHVLCLALDTTNHCSNESKESVCYHPKLMIHFLNQHKPVRPWCISTAPHPERPPEVVDLTKFVILWRDVYTGEIQYTIEGDLKPHPVPNLPMDLVERVLFPIKFRTRIAISEDFEPRDIDKMSHLGHPEDHDYSSWTEVAMHLVEVF